MRLRRRAAGLSLGAGVLFFLGTNVRAGWLLVLAALLLGSVLAGILLPLVALRGLEARIHAPQEARQRDGSFVDVALTNGARGMRWEVLVDDPHFQPVTSFVGNVRPGETIETTTLRTPLRRGEVVTESVRVRSSAPFGVAERRRRLAVGARTLVLPAMVPLGPLSFVEPVGTADRAEHASPRRGGGPDYLSIREYRPGDALRHVHWPSTARHGAVMVREFEEERTRRLAVVVDTERDAGESWTPLDRCCCVAASVVAAALAHGHGARLAAATESGDVDVVRRADEAELQRWLARLVPSGRPLAEVLDALGREDLRGVQTVLITMPAWPWSSIGPAVSALASRVSRVVCVPVGLTPEEGASADLDGLTAALRSGGVQVHPWPEGTDLAACLGAGRSDAAP